MAAWLSASAALEVAPSRPYADRDVVRLCRQGPDELGAESAAFLPAGMADLN